MLRSKQKSSNPVEKFALYFINSAHNEAKNKKNKKGGPEVDSPTFKVIKRTSSDYRTTNIARYINQAAYETRSPVCFNQCDITGQDKQKDTNHRPCMSETLIKQTITLFSTKCSTPRSNRRPNSSPKHRNDNHINSHSFLDG